MRSRLSADSEDPTRSIQSLLQEKPVSTLPEGFASEQQKDSDILEIVNFLEEEVHWNRSQLVKLHYKSPCSPSKTESCTTWTQRDSIYQQRVVVPKHLQEQIL